MNTYIWQASQESETLYRGKNLRIGDFDVNMSFLYFDLTLLLFFVSAWRLTPSPYFTKQIPLVYPYHQLLPFELGCVQINILTVFTQSYS